ncbi:MAG TPA: TonB-dependent receptor [Novosphingobium sp.]
MLTSMVAITTTLLLPSETWAQEGAGQPSQQTGDVVPSRESDGPIADGADQGIVVTGSRVKRDGFQAPTPLTMLGVEQIALTAPANVADVVNQLPALSTGLNPRAGNVGTSLGVGGLNILNLRNLGATRTLVLVDGRRVAGSTSSGLVDVNTIPQQLIERVEVVTGGASAAYGSDAVAGVVNFILNKNFTGLKYEAQAGISSRGDGGSRKIAASFGTKFADGRGHFLISGTYSDQDGVFNTNSRGWYNASKLVPTGSTPTFRLAAPVYISNAAAGGLILSGPNAGTQFGAGGAPSQFQFGTPAGAGLMIGGTPSDIAGAIPLAAEVRNRSVFSRLSFDATGDLNLFVEGSYARSKVFSPNVYQFKLGNLSIQSDNPFLPDSIRAPAGTGTALTFGTWNQDIGKLEVHNDIQTYRALGGLQWKLGGSWTLDAYYQYGRTDALNEVRNETITARYNQAIDAVRNSSGTIVCRDPANGCVPLNIIGTGVASPQAIAWVTGTTQRDSRIEQHVVAASIQGEPFSTWAGPVSVAFGGEYRKEKVSETVDALSLASAYFSGNFKPINGSYSVKEGFAEVVVPLAKDAPFLQSLEANGAVRVTDYTTSGTVTTWKIGATWRPVDDILFRFVRSRDIRAPNIADLFAQSQATQTVTDPFNGGRLDTITAFLNSGNPNLKPEIAQSFTAGVVLTPRWINGLSVSFDYYNIKIGGYITSIAGNTQQAVNLCFAGNQAACSLVTRGSDGHITSVRLAGTNAGSLRTSGFDIEAAYRFDLGAGRVSLRALASHLNKLNVDTSVVRTEYAGEVSGQNVLASVPAYFPKWRGSLTATYEQGGFTLGLVGRYIGKGVVANSFNSTTIANNNIKAVGYLDAAISYRFEDVKGSPEFFLTVENLLDRDPPRLAPNSALQFLNTGTSPGFYDTIGTSFRAGIRGKF